MKFNLHKLNRIAVVGLASVALIMPMAMNSNTSASASVNYLKKDPHLIAYGLINNKGQWIGPKHYQKMYDRGLLENDGVPNGAGDDVQTLADNAHISFWHAYRIWYREDLHGNEDISDLDYKYGVGYHHKHARRHHARKHVKRSRHNRKHTNRNHRMNHRHAKKHGRRRGRKSRVSHRRRRYTYRWY